jgi:hypothetical protein
VNRRRPRFAYLILMRWTTGAWVLSGCGFLAIVHSSITVCDPSILTQHLGIAVSGSAGPFTEALVCAPWDEQAWWLPSAGQAGRGTRPIRDLLIDIGHRPTQRGTHHHLMG